MPAVIFALNLEYLEGSFYSCATTGAPLPASVAGSATVEGCAKGSYTAATNSVLAEIASNEKNHVMVSQGSLPAAGPTAAQGGAAWQATGCGLSARLCRRVWMQYTCARVKKLGVTGWQATCACQSTCCRRLVHVAPACCASTWLTAAMLCPACCTAQQECLPGLAPPAGAAIAGSRRLNACCCAPAVYIIQA